VSVLESHRSGEKIALPGGIWSLRSATGAYLCYATNGSGEAAGRGSREHTHYLFANMLERGPKRSDRTSTHGSRQPPPFIGQWGVAFTLWY